MAQITLKALRDAERDMKRAAREYFKPKRVLGTTGETTITAHEWGFGVSAEFLLADDENKQYEKQGFSYAT